MKRIGILGGMSPESTIDYYNAIIHEYMDRFHAHTYPEIIIFSVRFGEIIPLMESKNWEVIGEKLAEAAQVLEISGADFIIIATNTMHKVVDVIQAGLKIPVLSLLDVLGEDIALKGLQKVAVLGTAYTMEDGFYSRALAKWGIEVLLPGAEDRSFINRVIFDELIAGVILEKSKNRYLEIIQQLIGEGAEGVVLGCTEIPLLVSPSEVSVPVFDTTSLHAAAALKLALEE